MISFSKSKNNTVSDKSIDLDIISSIWILACNDEIPLMTYQGIKLRLGLSDDIDVKALVKRRGELFRPQTPPSKLNEWKSEMLRGKRVPTWIREIKDIKEKISTINSLSETEVFRSQFRPDVKSPRSQIEIIDWGLQHLDRVRKADLEGKQEKSRRFATYGLPLLTAFIAIASIISSYYLQFEGMSNQKYLAHYQTELRPKQDGYGNFMKSISQSFTHAMQNDPLSMYRSLEQAETSFYVLEPFLSEGDRENVWLEFQHYSSLCSTIIEKEELRKNNKGVIDSYLMFKKEFRKKIYTALFALNN